MLVISGSGMSEKANLRIPFLNLPGQCEVRFRGQWFRRHCRVVEKRDIFPLSPTHLPCGSLHLIYSIPEMKKRVK